jgi:phosphoenolpyruvate carboxylase
MAGPFDFSNMISNINALTAKNQFEIARPMIPDNRTRSERREDFERRLEGIDKKSLEDLKEIISNASSSDELMELKEDIEDSLTKFIQYYDQFNNLNSEESRKVALKEKELKLDARYDWREKARLFLFRILGSALVVATLFAIGYIEHEYEWARLPMSKYLNTSTTIP